MSKYKFIPHSSYSRIKESIMIQKSISFYEMMKNRRSVRQFSPEYIPQDIIEKAILTAGTAPNGANMQPWHFVVVQDLKLKKQIRKEAEKVEKEFYENKAPDYWLDALAPLGTDQNKQFLEDAPALIVIFTQKHTVMPDETIKKHYYIHESVGIATGILITAIHNAGLASLTHTPKPMLFLRELLERPKHETPFLILAVGYPKDDVQVPEIRKKSLEEIATFK